MSIMVIDVNRNTKIKVPNLEIHTGTVTCLFRGDAPSADGVTRDILTFGVSPGPNIGEFPEPRQASCTMSLASFAYDGAVNDALWAVDRSTVIFTEDRGPGRVNFQVSADLAVKGPNGLILRVNYSIFAVTK